MHEISRKKGRVADFPLKLNLQLFAEEGYPSLEESEEFHVDAREFNSKMDKFISDRTPGEKVETEIENDPEPVEEEAGKPEVAEPDSKPKQDSETNKAFQEMRKAREEAERIAKEAQERSKRADALISQQYGHMGITTVEQYEAAVKAEKEAADASRYEESGLKPEEIEAIRNYESLKMQVEEQNQRLVRDTQMTQWDQLYTTYPELVESSEVFKTGGTPEWFTPEMRAEIERGASPLAAYRNAHFEKIISAKLGETREIAKQEALDKINSKEHLAPNASTGGEVDHVEIDEETMRMYRALNKGKTDAQIRAWHKKNAGK